MHKKIIKGSKEDVNNEIRVWDEAGNEYTIKGNRIRMYEYIERMIGTSDYLESVYDVATRKLGDNINVLEYIRYLIGECEKIIIERAKFEENLNQKFYGYYQGLASEQEKSYYEEFKNVDLDFQDFISDLNSLIISKDRMPENVFESKLNEALYRLNNAKDRVVYTDRELSSALSRAMEQNHIMRDSGNMSKSYSQNRPLANQISKSEDTKGPSGFASFPPQGAKDGGEKFEVKVEGRIESERTNAKLEGSVESEKANAKLERSIESEKADVKLEGSVESEKADAKLEDSVESEKAEPKLEASAGNQKVDMDIEKQNSSDTNQMLNDVSTSFIRRRSLPRRMNRYKTEQMIKDMRRV